MNLPSESSCVGCWACENICPTNSISMQGNNEGFLFPVINTSTCIKCKKCEQTCPVVNCHNIKLEYKHPTVLSAQCNDGDIRLNSSSGGLFFVLAKYVIEHGGVVFGARFDDYFGVMHDCAKSLYELDAFMRSKYVQSKTENTYKIAEDFLRQGKFVLYSGTPCQLAGLRSFLKKEYSNLIQVDIVCHGVPSPGVWMDYLKLICHNHYLTSVNFRDKSDGWTQNQKIVLKTADYTITHLQKEDAFFNGFVRNIFLRKSCYNCLYKGIHRKTDITLGDFWGIQNLRPEMNDEKGTSLVLLHSEKAKQLFDEIKSYCTITRHSIDDAIKYNNSLIDSPTKPQRRFDFFIVYRLFGLKYALRFVEKDRFYIRIIRKINKIFHK